jgi:lipopolysaccharide export system protein LptA
MSKPIFCQILKCLLICCIFCSPYSFADAAEKDSSKPIDIQSDAAHFEEKTSLTTHEGNVHVTQGTRSLWADKLVIHRTGEGKIDHMVATGKPARFEALTHPNKPKLQGEAKIIHYYLENHKIVLLWNAKLSQNAQSIRGDSLTYFLDTKTLVSTPSTQSKTTVILNEKRQP